MVPSKQPNSVGHSSALTIPELEQSKTAVLNTLASVHSRRSYEYAIDRFIAWYCSEPRLTFNRSVVVRYREPADPGDFHRLSNAEATALGRPSASIHCIVVIQIRGNASTW